MFTIISRFYNTSPVVRLPLRREGGDVAEALSVFCLFYPSILYTMFEAKWVKQGLNKGEESCFTIRVNNIHNDAAMMPNSVRDDAQTICLRPDKKQRDG